VVVFGREKHTRNSLSTFSVNVVAPSRGGEDPEAHARPSAQSIVLASYDSRPLSDDVRVINKVSQNLHSEILLRLLGREKGTAGTVEGGLEVLKSFLTTAGVPNDQYLFYDGSGLSRQNLVSPHAIVQLLRYASSQPWGGLYRETLPVAGVDGSLVERMKDPSFRTRSC
jgi:D-alanyl-D-alanine carboxypeptidase/D-alanyl-D-alanine-endopeptidase (penicillin-binding protein 4)